MRLDEFSIQADYYAETTLSCRSQRSAEHAGSANVTNSLTRALRHNGCTRAASGKTLASHLEKRTQGAPWRRPSFFLELLPKVLTNHDGYRKKSCASPQPHFQD